MTATLILWTNIQKYPPELSSGVIDFLELALAKDPAQRPSADELIDHPWVKSQQTSASSSIDGDTFHARYLQNSHQDILLLDFASVCCLNYFRSSSPQVDIWYDEEHLHPLVNSCMAQQLALGKYFKIVACCAWWAGEGLRVVLCSLY